MSDRVLASRDLATVRCRVEEHAHGERRKRIAEHDAELVGLEAFEEEGVHCLRETYAEATRDADATRQTLLDNQPSTQVNLDDADTTVTGLRNEPALVAGEGGIEDNEMLRAVADRALHIAGLSHEIGGSEALFTGQRGGRSIAELEADGFGRDLADVKTTIDACKESRKTVSEQEIDATDEERNLARNFATMHGSDAVFEAGRAQLGRSQAVEVAEHYCRVVLARFLAEESIRRYSEVHQDPVLQRASCSIEVLTERPYRKVGVGDETKKDPRLSATYLGGEERLGMGAYQHAGNCKLHLPVSSRRKPRCGEIQGEILLHRTNSSWPTRLAMSSAAFQLNVLDGINAVADGAFTQGLWGPVGDCNAVLGSLVSNFVRLSLAPPCAPGRLRVFRRKAVADCACDGTLLLGLSHHQVLVHLWGLYVAGPPLQPCFSEYTQTTCVPHLSAPPSQFGWHSYQALISIRARSSRSFYATGLPSDHGCAAEYALVSLRRLATVDIRTALLTSPKLTAADPVKSSRNFRSVTPNRHREGNQLHRRARAIGRGWPRATRVHEPLTPLGAVPAALATNSACDTALHSNRARLRLSPLTLTLWLRWACSRISGRTTFASPPAYLMSVVHPKKVLLRPKNLTALLSVHRYLRGTNPANRIPAAQPASL